MPTSRLTLLAILSIAGAPYPAAAQPTTQEIRTLVRTSVETMRRTVGRYQGGGERETQTERQTRTVKLGMSGEIDVSNLAGDIIFTKGSGETATIEIVKTARGRTVEDAKEQLRRLPVDVTERGSRVELRSQYPRVPGRRSFSASVAYTISAPPGTRVTAQSLSGDISVSDITGDLSLNSISGNIRVSRAGRINSAKTVSGNVEITDTQMDGALEAASISGSVIVRRVKARRVDAGAISGAIVIDDIECDRVNAHSFSGDVEFTGALVKNGRYALKSHSGDVRIAVVGATGFELDANSFSGSVRSDLPLSLSGGGADARRGRRTRALRGVNGDGSAVLDVTTFSGSIVLAKR